MRLIRTALGLLCILALSGSAALAATIAGSVKGPDGSAFKGAFVEAQNTQSKVTFNTLSHADGAYRIENLPPGSYNLQIRAVGYKGDPRPGLNLAADQHASFDFNLQKGLVRWTDLSIYQGTTLLPDGPGKTKLTTACFACHGFQSRMASTVRDESGWRDRVRYMRTTFGYLLGGVDDQDADNVVAYLTKEFGPDSDLPRSPADLPEYASVKQDFSDSAMRINYVTFEMPGSNRFPGASTPERDGKVYIWTYNQHRFAVLDPKTAKVTEYLIPGVDQASNHSTRLAPDGSVWFTEQAQNVIGRLDPATNEIATYTDNVPGRRHTMVIDSKGVVYSTGEPLAKFDPKTKEFTNYPEVPSAYGLVTDAQDTVWFSEFKKDGKIGKIDPATNKVTKYALPTADAYPRRMHFDTKGILWICEYRAGKIASFDPKTNAFNEYDLPGPDATPYAMNIDKKGHIWYSSMDTDIVGELDPSTGHVTKYPFVYPENGMRDFFMDADGNMWWGSQPNNHVGYFYLAGPEINDREDAKAPANKNKSGQAPSVIQE
jgi:virginiamycin B lyase